MSWIDNQLGHYLIAPEKHKVRCWNRWVNPFTLHSVSLALLCFSDGRQWKILPQIQNSTFLIHSTYQESTLHSPYFTWNIKDNFYWYIGK